MTPHDYNKIIRRLKSMPLEMTLDLKRNAILALSRPDKYPEKRVQRLIAAIHDECDRRKINNNYFKWPTTDAKIGRRALKSSNWQIDGLLSRMHYTVGQTSKLSTTNRRAILEDAFLNPLPPINSHWYMAQWGEPGSAKRLKKMAKSTAAFARNAKRQQGRNMATAIDDWETDLAHLHDTFYVGQFDFWWPTTRYPRKTIGSGHAPNRNRRQKIPPTNSWSTVKPISWLHRPPGLGRSITRPSHRS